MEDKILETLKRASKLDEKICVNEMFDIQETTVEYDEKLAEKNIKELEAIDYNFETEYCEEDKEYGNN